MSAAAKAATTSVVAPRGVSRRKEAKAARGGVDGAEQRDAAADILNDGGDSTEGDHYNNVTLAGRGEEDGKGRTGARQSERAGSDGSGDGSSLGRHRAVLPHSSPRALHVNGASPRAIGRGATWSTGSHSISRGGGGGGRNDWAGVESSRTFANKGIKLAWAGLDSIFHSGPSIMRRSRSVRDGDDEHHMMRTRNQGLHRRAAGGDSHGDRGSPPSLDLGAAAADSVVSCYGGLRGHRSDRLAVQGEGWEEDEKKRSESGHGSRLLFTPPMLRTAHCPVPPVPMCCPPRASRPALHAPFRAARPALPAPFHAARPALPALRAARLVLPGPHYPPRSALPAPLYPPRPVNSSSYWLPAQQQLRAQQAAARACHPARNSGRTHSGNR
ncbi:unnamed protein product [Closterium sp. Naga37s-1]|nr:unnamed protein product [Closterium sp. Naga37s-1]